MTDDASSLYLQDLGDLVKQAGLEAKRVARTAEETDRQFALGRLSAFYEIISLMQQQAEAFNLELVAVGLEDIDPDRELI
ncbi:hypothetical protein MUN74_06895 [Agromyces endophyticus]|uniref:hypothetical protein n=1 Tax=Agromyces sp. H17E-10 TaxID=2932244 RepID=UPI001FD3F2ED|nr:hypothetical protein [Agromyces sp. H17E-10]UOQ90631.1 hypothetical protein MUN74_06895 [Agromyces sp. H17E-10]